MAIITTRTVLGTITFDHQKGAVKINGSKRALKVWNYIIENQGLHGAYGLQFSLDNCKISDLAYQLNAIYNDENSIFLDIDWPKGIGDKINEELKYPEGAIP